MEAYFHNLPPQAGRLMVAGAMIMLVGIIVGYALARNTQAES